MYGYYNVDCNIIDMYTQAVNWESITCLQIIVRALICSQTYSGTYSIERKV